MINIEKIKENIKCPQFGDLEYGKWGALRLEQRIAYKELIEEIEHLTSIIALRYERPYAKRYLGELRKEQPNLLYPDSEKIYEDYYKTREELERLNNIINELERYIEKSKHLASGIYEFKGIAYMFYYNKTDELFDKLKELKGSDKE